MEFSSCKRGVYSYTNLLQETRKISKEPPNLTPKRRTHKAHSDKGKTSRGREQREMEQRRRNDRESSETKRWFFEITHKVIDL